MQALGSVCLRLVPLSPSLVVSLGHATVQRVHANPAGRGAGQAGVGTSAVAAVRGGKGSFLCSPFSWDTSLAVPREPCVTLAPLPAPVA